MKSEIDKLVSEFRRALAEPDPAMPELGAAFQRLGVDRHTRAAQSRAAIEQYADDPLVPQDVREYAQQQLARLPAF